VSRGAKLDVVFDLDGTLSDPSEGFFRSMRAATAALGRPAPTDATLRPWIGPPLRDAFRVLLDTEVEDEVERGVAHYRERYARIGWRENRLYDGVPAMLDALRAAGHRLFVATSKPGVFAERILDHFDLRRRFERVRGGELGAGLDGKERVLAALLAEAALDPGGAIMIGDREHDARAACVLGLRAIGVLWGHGSRGELEAAGAEHLCEAPHALPDIVSRLAR